MEEFFSFWRRVRFLCVKELLAVFKDKVSRGILLVPVLMQGLLFGYGATYNLNEVPYVAVDESHSAASIDLLAHIDSVTTFQRAATLDSPAGIGDRIASEDAMMAIVIPQDFSDQLSRGAAAPVQLITDGRNTNAAGLIASYVSRIVAAWNAERAGGASIELISRTWFNPNQITQWNFLPALIGMISFTQVVMLAGLSVAKEREQGTFDQLLVTPLSPAAILIGKAVPPMLIGLFQGTVLLLLARFWFDVPFAGSLWTLYLVLLAFDLASTGIGLTVSAIADNMQQVLVYVFVLLLPLALLSGLVSPVRNMPEALQIFTYCDPLRFEIDGLRRVYLEGATLADIAGIFPPLLSVAAVTLAAAGYLFRHKLT